MLDGIPLPVLGLSNSRGRPDSVISGRWSVPIILCASLLGRLVFEDGELKRRSYFPEHSGKRKIIAKTVILGELELRDSLVSRGDGAGFPPITVGPAAHKLLHSLRGGEVEGFRRICLDALH